MSICGWLVMAFDSEEHDPRDYLVTEYSGLTLHIRPGHRDAVSLVSTFLEDRAEYAEAQLVINRFLSAMAWKEGKAFVTLGSIVGGAHASERDKRFNYNEGRVLRYGVISRFDFEHLPSPRDNKQKLALALYREGLNSRENQFYGFLSFFKILNIKFPTGKEQVAWINANLGKLWNFVAQERLTALQTAHADVGEYLWKEGRNAVAHAYSEPVLDPDIPTDRTEITRNADLMQGVAEVFVQEELGVPSQRKIWREHLYELVGFKSILGEALTARLEAKQDVPLADFPVLPPLTLGLKDHPPFECLTALRFQIAACRKGVVFLMTDHREQPMAVSLVLDIPGERLELALNQFGVNQKQAGYTKTLGACFYRFLIGYYCNGRLQVFDADNGNRIGHKTAFLPMNVDLHETVENWRKRIVELESD